MEEWCAGEEHEGAVAFHQAYAVLKAKLSGLFADRALSAPAMHPYPAHTGFRAHHAIGVLRRGDNDDALNRRSYLLQMGKTAAVFQFSRGWKVCGGEKETKEQSNGVSENLLV